MNKRTRLAPADRIALILAAAGRVALRVGLYNITRDAVALEAKCSTGLVSKYGDTEMLKLFTLHEAVKHNNAEIVSHALERGAMVNAPDALLKRARALVPATPTK